jgi:tRNA threonylcarbamoyladenosine modification (KEOPS) complex  Pcc1 subunit
MTPNDTLIPITTIKGIRPNGIILLTGEVIQDKSPKFKNLHGTEDSEAQAIYSSVIEMSKVVAELVEDIADLRTKVTKELNNTTKIAQSVLSQASKEAINLSRLSKMSLERTDEAVRLATKASQEVSRLGKTLNSYLTDLEEQVDGGL